MVPYEHECDESINLLFCTVTRLGLKQKLNNNTLYAKLSPVSTRGHQSQFSHMIEWGW